MTKFKGSNRDEHEIECLKEASINLFIAISY